MSRFSKLILVLLIAGACASAKTVSVDEAHTAAATWLASNATDDGQSRNILSIMQLQNAIGAPIPLYYISLSPTGYIVMTADDSLPPVIAFSWTSRRQKPALGTPFHSLLQRQGKEFDSELSVFTRSYVGDDLENIITWNRLLNKAETRADNGSSLIVPVLFEMTWHQEEPFNLLCPMDDVGNKAVCGCVPLALAEVMNYHEWPPRGREIKRWEDKKSSIKAKLETSFSVDFNWQNILPKYSDDIIDENSMEVAKLLIRLGILCEADYDEETGAYTENIVEYLPRFLHYSTPILTKRDWRYPNKLSELVIKDLKKGLPVLVSSDQHQYVACGLKMDDNKYYCYFNYGWGGEDDGWYLLFGGYYNRPFDDILTNIEPAPVPLFRPIDRRQPPGAVIEWDFPRRLAVEAFRLSVEQDGITTELSASIPPEDRSYALDSSLTGYLVLRLQAMVGGEWQSVSEPLELDIGDYDEEPFQVFANVFANENDTMDIEIHSNHCIADVNVTMLRPDLFPQVTVNHVDESPYALVSCSKPSKPLDHSLATINVMDTQGNGKKMDVWLNMESLSARSFTIDEIPEKCGDGGNGDILLKIKSNACWRIESDVEWFSFQKSQGMGDAEIRMDFVANPSTEERIGTIRVFYENDCEAMSFTVSQPSGFMESQISLRAGWNLLSLPGRPTPEAMDILLAYPIFQYEQKSRTYSRPQKMLEATPYWIYAQEKSIVVLPMVKSHRPLVLSRYGWNFVGVTDEQALPEGYFAWQWNGHAYVLSEPTMLEPGKAYWIILDKQ